LASKEEELHFQAMLLEAVGQSVVATDLEGKVLYWDRAAEEIYGWSSEEALGRSLRDLTVCEESLEKVEEVGSVLRAGRAWSGETLLRRKDGSHVPVLGTASPLFDDRGSLVGMIGVSTDISERKTLEVELERRASHDPLTGLPNRPAFVDRLEQALQRTRRRKNSRNKVGVLFMDLDGFKTINDSLGHEAGDRFLVTVAERLKNRLRPEDVLARFGGDEFAVLLEDVANVTEAIWVAQRIAEGLQEPLAVNSHQVSVSTSVGIALGSANTNDDPEGMLRKADAAMYQAKEQGPGRYAVFDPAMQERAQERLELEAELRKALERGEFLLYYQPEVSLRDGTIVGFEALLRWQHPQRPTQTSGLHASGRGDGPDRAHRQVGAGGSLRASEAVGRGASLCPSRDDRGQPLLKTTGAPRVDTNHRRSPYASRHRSSPLGARPHRDHPNKGFGGQRSSTGRLEEDGDPVAPGRLRHRLFLTLVPEALSC
jgi:diguanylate cyclase (GGDEF)-like protein/PAS domain S-box-containing protein